MKLKDKYIPFLTIDASGQNCGVAVFADVLKITEINFFQKNAHSEKLFEIIEKAEALAGIERESFKAIAVSAGPGSFTGLRIGMSAAKGLALGLGIPILPIPNFEAYGYSVSKYFNRDQEFSIALKANKDEFYYSKFLYENGKCILQKTALLDLEAIKLETQNDGILFSDQADIFNGFQPKLKAVDFVYPGARVYAEWAYFFGEHLLTYNLDFIEPFYLKDFIARQKK